MDNIGSAGARPSPTMIVLSRVISTRAAVPRTSFPTLDSWPHPRGHMGMKRRLWSVYTSELGQRSLHQKYRHNVSTNNIYIISFSSFPRGCFSLRTNKPF